MYLLGNRRLITKTMTAQEILDEQSMLMRACISEHSLLAYSKQVYMKMQFVSQIQAYFHERELYMHALNITSRQDLVC